MSKSTVVRRNTGGSKNVNRSEKTKSAHIMENVVGCTDMVLLDPLHEDNLIKNLRMRFNAGEIYTYIGRVVISVNPCRPLEIYSPAYIAKYRSSNMFELPPHVYALSDDAYRSMRDRNVDQCMIISGESGAGKTEASKLIMQYVSEVSGKGEEVNLVKQQLLQSNPVLEAFGNAKTRKNDNSSRFGKYMDIEFDYKGDPVGGVISTYLLEKSRVIYTNPGERNFHIFFKLLAGTDPDLLEMIHLENDPSKYKYLCTSDGAVPGTIEGEPSLDSTIKSMETIGFSTDEMISIFELLSAILNLGNIEFQNSQLSDGSNTCNLVNQDAAIFACDMLGCSFQLLEQCLTKKIVETSRDVVVTSITAIEASYIRDGLCKAIYDRIFKWIVERINEKIEPTKRGKRKSMGVLDIYGFEVFEKNGFEQFMINYCNEKLQQLFLELTLGTEQDEYIREGIEWVKIEYFDNAVICQMIEDSGNGMIAIMNEECLRPGRKSDKTFIDRLNQVYSDHDHYVSRASEGYQSDTSIEFEEFQLVHYAGTVTYNTTGFIDLNRDHLYKEMSNAMFACERPLLKTLFKEGDPEAEISRRPSTTGQKFKASIAEMMKNLQSKNPHYVRCIKPNDNKDAKKFDSHVVRSQVRYMNMMENIKVQRTGYAFRQTYAEALSRYKMLSAKTWPVWKRRPKDGVKAIFEDNGYKLDEDYSYGRTKLFVRTPKVIFEMEEKRAKKMQEFATLIEKIIRGWLARRKFQKMKESQITIAKHFRGSKCRKQYLSLRNATIVFQKYTRGWKVRYEKDRERRMWCIKRYISRWKLIKTINQRIYKKKFTHSAIVIQKYYRGWKVRKRMRMTNKKMGHGEAAPLVINFIKRSLRYRFLVTLLYNLPSVSPIDKKWPRPTPLFKSTSVLLRNIYHKWRCQQVVNYYLSRPRERQRMMEKLKASSLFKRKKALYPSSVPVQFVADRLNLQNDPRWAKSVAKDKSIEGSSRVIWSDNVRKLNRTDAKLTNKSIAITSTAIYVLDPRNYGLQHIIRLRDIEGVSLSPHRDHFFVLHLDSDRLHDKTYPKGDLILENPNVIECVTKLAMAYTDSQQREILVQFKADIGLQLKSGDTTLLKFLQTEPGASSPMCKKKGNLLTISVDQ